MAETVATPKAKNVVGWVIGVLMLGAVAFAIGYGLKKGQKVAA